MVSTLTTWVSIVATCQCDICSESVGRDEVRGQGAGSAQSDPDALPFGGTSEARRDPARRARLSVTAVRPTRAGVAVQTIYVSCGSKRELVLAFVDTINEEADVATIAARLAESNEPEELISLGGRLTASSTSAAATSSAHCCQPQRPSSRTPQPPPRTGGRRHRDGTSRTAHKLHALGALHDGSRADGGGALLATLNWRPVYAQLTQEHGSDV